MPTYEYACTSCGHEWEFEQSIKDSPLTECPACKQGTAKRQISRGTGFILKGGGWYSDLYASSGNKGPSGDSSSSSTTSTTSTKAADTSAAKSDSSASSTASSGSSGASSPPAASS
ncbi:MAG: zinc ribbon domain-containing protein [Byssovorax sp.]